MSVQSRTARPFPAHLPSHPSHPRKTPEGNGFSRAKNQPAPQEPTLLPQAGVEPKAKRLNCPPQFSHQPPRYTETNSGIRLIGARAATAAEIRQYEEVS
jgi:hypothetical protein